MEEDLKTFEQSYIHKLQEERERIQAKTFTKWINMHLIKVMLKVNDIFKDLRDGKNLMSLLEVISNVNLGKRNRGTLRVQNIENVNKALKYIQSKVTLENIGAEDIVDGNHRLTLGLIWTIILRFQIQEMLIDSESGANKSAKESLLLWCQRKTKGYKNVDIKDFHRSWRNGLGFNALIHAHCPHLLDYDKLTPENHENNLNHAFTIAEKELGIPNLLDSEDIDVERPDDKSIMTYISSLYLTFAKMKTENTGAKRVGKIVSNVMEVSNLIVDYENLVKSLLMWIQKKTIQLNKRDLPNSLKQMQNQMAEFKEYRTIEKPPKFADRSEIDDKLFQIIIKQKENNMKSYIPSENLVLKEVEVAWENLEKAEHAREMILREELLRQGRLEQAAEKFNKKAVLRESWLNEKFSVLKNMDIGSNTQSIEAQINQEELIKSEINNSKERFHKLRELAISLEDNKYHGKDIISQRNDDIQSRWRKLHDSIANKQSNSEKVAILTGISRTIDIIRSELEILKPRISSTEFGNHIVAAEDIAGRHNLIDSQLKALSQRFNQIRYKAQDFLQSIKSQNLTTDQRETLEFQLKNLNDDIDNFNTLSNNRREKLIQNCNFLKLMRDLEEEKNWLSEQIEIMSNKDPGHDYSSVLRFIRRHKVYELEIKAHVPIFQNLKQQAMELYKYQCVQKEEIEKVIEELSKSWNSLEAAKKQRSILLKDAYECQKYYTDVDDAEQWISEHLPLALSTENGEDEGASEALLKRQQALLDEVTVFGNHDMKRLQRLSTLMTKPEHQHNIRPDELRKLKKIDSINLENVEIENDMIQIPVESEFLVDKDEDMLYRAINDYATKDINNKDMSIIKNEVYKVLKKVDDTQWLVESKEHSKLYVLPSCLRPLNNLTKIGNEPKSTVMKWFPIDSDIAKNYLMKQNRMSMHSDVFGGPSIRKEDDLHFDKANIEDRQDKLDIQYKELLGINKARSYNLRGSILNHQFHKEYNTFMKWMKNKEEEFDQSCNIAFDVEGTKKKYEAIIDDLAANSGRIKYVNDLLKKLLEMDPKTDNDIASLNPNILSQIPFPIEKDNINAKYEEIRGQWEKLNKLKCDKEKSLAGTSSIELFNKTGDEVKETMEQKLEMLTNDNVGYDKETNDILKRKFQNLLRDVEAIKNRIERFKYLGDGVKSTYPSEIEYVDNRINEIDSIYDNLQKNIHERENHLNNAGNVHKFFNDSKENDQKLHDLTVVIENLIIPKDIHSIESCMQQTDSLKHEICMADENLDCLKKLSNDVLAEKPNDATVLSTITKLNDKLADLKMKETERTKKLEDALQTQKFYKKCDQLESLISEQSCKLNSINPELSVDDIERALKNQANLEVSLDQIKDRVNDLSDQAHQLKELSNYDKIATRSDKVVQNLMKLGENCKEKKNILESDLEYTKFNENANEFNEWMDDKIDIVQDDNYKDLFNLSEKLQKIKATEAEINANSSSLEKVKNLGNDLLNNNHPKSSLVEDILKNVNDKWTKLKNCAEEKEHKIRQAQEQYELNQNMDDILRNFDSIENTVKSQTTGNDLISAKSLIEKHRALESELLSQEEKSLKLKQKAFEMNDKDHFDKVKIQNDVLKLESRCNELTPLVNKRNQDLDNNFQWHQFSFNVDQEMQWIEEHRPTSSINDWGRSMAEAVKLANNHKKLMNEISSHKAVVNKLLNDGENLQVELGPMYKKDIETRNSKLRDNWKELETQSEDRKFKLELSIEGCQLLDDFNDIDSWILEKSYYIDQCDEDLDNDQIESRIMKIKNINVDLETYENLLTNINQKVLTFQDRCRRNSILPGLFDAVNRKSNDVLDNFNSFNHSLNNKVNTLQDSQDFQLLQIEISDIEGWIEDNVKVASSNDFGDDLQQMQQLKDRWDHQSKVIDLGSCRVQSCNEKVEKLLKQQNSQSSDITSLQNDMLKEWNLLKDLVLKKNLKFQEAEEVHKFNKSCHDLQTIIDVNNNPLQTKHKERNGVDGAKIKFEKFLKEKEKMNCEFKEIYDDGVKLQLKFPNKATVVKLQLDKLEEAWRNLDDYANQKKSELQYSIDYVNLYNKLKETMAFLNDINVKIKTDRHISTVLAAKDQLSEANECLTRLTNHNEMLKNFLKINEDIIKDDVNNLSEEIRKDVDEILAKLNSTEDALKDWVEKSEQKLAQQKCFLEIYQINSNTKFQEVKVQVNNFDLDLEETEKLLVRHQNFSHNINVTDDRVKMLSSSVDNMKLTNHFDIENITEMLDDCFSKRQKLHDNYDNIKMKLRDQLNWFIFLRESDDKNLWIDEKLQQIKTLDKSVNSLEEKIHFIQKYKAFESEISTNIPEFEKFNLNAEELLKSNHPKSKDIKEILSNTLKKWDLLISESKHQSSILQEAKDLLLFIDEFDAVETWLREKEFLVSVNDLGLDLDHCKALQTKLSEPVNGKQVDEERINDIVRTADEILHHKTVPALEADNIKSKSQSIKPRWDALKTELEAYKKRLEESFKIHSYYNEMELLSDQIKDRIKLINLNDLGTDVESVEKLRRKQNGIERDIVVLNEKFQKLCTLGIMGDNLNPEHAIRINLKQKIIKDDLEHLISLITQMAELLNLSYKFFKVKKDCTVLINILSNQTELINKSDWPIDSETTKTALKIHEDLKTDIGSKRIKENRINDVCRKLKQECNNVKDKVHDQNITIIPTGEQLDSLQDSLLSSVKELQNSWTKRLSQLNECLQIHTFLDACKIEEQWISTQDKKYDDICKNIGSSMTVEDIVENLEIKRSISSAVHSRENKIINGTLLESLEKLRKNDIQDLNQAEAKYKFLTIQLNQLKEKLMELQKNLISEKELQELIQKVLDHIVWIRNKMLIASDLDYENKVNLSNKIKKHKDFMSEIKANEPDYQSVVDSGKKLISENHIHSVEIEQEIANLENQWNTLLTMNDFKMQRLLETNDELLWSRKAEAFEFWIDEMEKSFESNDYESDLMSVEKLKRKHADIEVDIAFHKGQLPALESDAMKMINGNNYLSEDIKTHLQEINNRFIKLELFLQNHSENLMDIELLYQMNCDVFYQLDWIQDKLKLAEKVELGSSLAETQLFINQHEILMSEISMRSKIIDEINDKGLYLEKRDHFAKDAIKSQIAKLLNSYERLCNAKENRSVKLSEIKIYHQLINDITVVDMRLNDKILLLRSLDKDADEQSCQYLLKKLDHDLEIDSENANMISFAERVSKVSTEYQKKANQPLNNLQLKLNEIKEIIQTKKTIITSNLKYYQYVRETNDLLTWIKNQNNVVLIEEYGTDFESCTILIEKFEAFFQSFNASKSKVTSAKSSGKQLIGEKNPHSSQIEKIIDSINNSMNELKENFKIRKEALQGACEVHSFVRECNDLISWIKNKNIEISSLKQAEKSADHDGTEVYSDKTEAIMSKEFNKPLSVIKKIENNFLKFERDLEAIQNQIGRLNIESIRLQNIYPDTKDHIMEKCAEYVNNWNNLTISVVQKRNKLKEMKMLQSWLIGYKELLKWTKAQNILITSINALPTDINGAELLLVINNNHKLEIDSKVSEYHQLIEKGKVIKCNSQFICHIIEEKLTLIKKVWENMCANLVQRRELYEQNIDLRKFLSGVIDLEKWLGINENQMKSIEEKSFKNVPEIEEAAKNHDDYIKFVDSEKIKFEAIKRLTKLENALLQPINEKISSEMLMNKEINSKIKTETETERITQEKIITNESLQEIGSVDTTGSTVLLSEDMGMTRFFENPESNETDWIKESNIKSVNLNMSASMNADELSKINLGDTFADDLVSKKYIPGFSTKKRNTLKTKLTGSSTKENAEVILSKSLISGTLNKKKIKATKGIKAVVRSWNEYFAVLENQILLFYKNKSSFLSKHENPLCSNNIHNSVIEIAKNYTKRDFVIHIHLEDMSEMYLQLKSSTEQLRWLSKLHEGSKSELKPINISKKIEHQYEPIDVATVMEINDFDMCSENQTNSNRDYEFQKSLERPEMSSSKASENDNNYIGFKIQGNSNN